MDYLEQKQLELKQKSAWIGYFFLFIFGAFGAHRFYSGKKKSGLLMLALNIVFIFLSVITFAKPISIYHHHLLLSKPLAMQAFEVLFLLAIIWIWQIIDLFFIYKWIRKYNLSLFENYKKM